MATVSQKETIEALKVGLASSGLIIVFILWVVGSAYILGLR